MNISIASSPVSGINAPGAVASAQSMDKTIVTPEKTQPPQAAEPKTAQENKSAEATKEMAETLNEIMNDLGTNLGFHIREEHDNQVVVELKNRETDEVIKQIPSEELMIIMEKMEDLSGLIFDGQI